MAVQSTAIIILGASGDLAKRKLIPALSRLFEKGEIDSSSIIVGSGRSDFDTEAFRRRFEVCPDFASILHYHRGIEGIHDFIISKGTFGKVIVFLSLPPKVYSATARELAAEGFGDETTIIIEKPFGYDFESARKLNGELHEVFDERQLFRIDHYLAKEAVQNILVFRFANALFYPVWNSRYIHSIQINAQEDIGVEDRGAYFDGAGTMRDVVQNHLLQLLSLLTMEAPVSLDAAEIRQQKLSVLKALEVEESHRGQYRGYRSEKGIDPDSTTETFVEMKLRVENFRWTGMPVYLRAGKLLGRKGTEIAVNFKPLPRLLFNRDGGLAPNRIVFKIQPSEGIIVDLASKVPGNSISIRNTNLVFCYKHSFDVEIPEAYQRLLLDAIKGDGTLFVSAEETELAWLKIAPFLDSGPLTLYDPGTVPPAHFDLQWVDFEQYGTVCP